ncbi:sensor histidine kinase [Bacillus horti]|uniref:histidine kinase n=1 Tax=Caldalkalibacillus horti TaxID=77523 RepID=A0ABT9VV13_9BACI|nr:histidine kinase [Bacillus horti]MDQ0164720.1 signal transduction histidine kinase [Bacillus horti]
MAHTFWIWLLLLGSSWTAAINQVHEDKMIFAMLGCAIFFSLFFVAPLLREKPKALTAVLLGCMAVTAIALWPEKTNVAPNYYTLLIYSILVGKAVFRLSSTYSIAIGLCMTVISILPTLLGYPSFPLWFLLIYAIAFGLGCGIYKWIFNEWEQNTYEKDEMLSEYRRLKRSSVDSEEVVRQQERSKIARDMHDSVGHKLTALLMQLEVFRMQSTGETAERAEALKRLAKESLEETRHAVKELNVQETIGFQAIIHLIRKWESENFVRVQFSLRQGVLTAQLNNEQSAAIYRAVQEALTNAIRHSSSREINIEFEAPGGRALLFKISNPCTKKDNFREGFGLSAMRERMEQLGGQLEIIFEDRQFTVKGRLPL